MEEVNKIAPELLYEILFPVLAETCEKVNRQFSQALGIDMSSSGWSFIIDNRQLSDFQKPFVLEADWASFAEFFSGKKDLYLFLEKPVVGIVNKKAKYWVFFDPKIAQAYFQRQTERPKEFGPQAIKKFPVPNLLKSLVDQVQAITGEKAEKAMHQIKKIETFYTIADQFLPEQAAQGFSNTVKKTIIGITLKEVRQLGQDVSDPGVTPTLLEKRLQAVFRVCLRLYAKKGDDRERDSLMTLLSPKIVVRKKALELVEKRLQVDLV